MKKPKNPIFPRFPRLRAGRLCLILLAAAAVVSVGAVSVGKLFALYQEKTHTATNLLAIGNPVRLEVTEDFTQGTPVKPGASAAKTPAVKNTSPDEVYVRVRVYQDMYGATPYFSFTYDAANWTQRGDYYYYKTTLAPSATTSPLFTSVTLNAFAGLTDAQKAELNPTPTLIVYAEGSINMWP